MNFADFCQYRDVVLRERGNVLNCAEMNLYRSLNRLIPQRPPSMAKTTHRCHLAAEWAERMRIPTTAHAALCSSGVRDSLATLFRHYSTADTKLWLPTDNYPVYGEIAAAAGLDCNWFGTIPKPKWPSDKPTLQMELLLVSNPLKPLGRWLDPHDETALIDWLNADSRRRLLLDTVYTFATEFHSSTLRLLETGQTILLHSLTKGWLHPKLFGIALVPNSDVATLMPCFRSNPPTQSSLAHARDLLAHHSEMPIAISNELLGARSRLLSAVPTIPNSSVRPDSAPGYFVIVPRSADEWLNKRNVLGIPPTVFGASRTDLTVLSSLRFLE